MVASPSTHSFELVPYAHFRLHPINKFFTSQRRAWCHVVPLQRNVSEVPPHIKRLLAALSHRLSSSSVHVSGSPAGSFWAGNISPPKMPETDASTTRPAKPKNKFRDCIARSIGVGMMFTIYCRNDEGSAERMLLYLNKDHISSGQPGQVSFKNAVALLVFLCACFETLVIGVPGSTCECTGCSVYLRVALRATPMTSDKLLISGPTFPPHKSQNCPEIRERSPDQRRILTTIPTQTQHESRSNYLHPDSQSPKICLAKLQTSSNSSRSLEGRMPHVRLTPSTLSRLESVPNQSRLVGFALHLSAIATANMHCSVL